MTDNQSLSTAELDKERRWFLSAYKIPNDQLKSEAVYRLQILTGGRPASLDLVRVLLDRELRERKSAIDPFDASAYARNLTAAAYAQYPAAFRWYRACVQISADTAPTPAGLAAARNAAEQVVASPMLRADAAVGLVRIDWDLNQRRYAARFDLAWHLMPGAEECDPDCRSRNGLRDIHQAAFETVRRLQYWPADLFNYHRDFGAASLRDGTNFAPVRSAMSGAPARAVLSFVDASPLDAFVVHRGIKLLQAAAPGSSADRTLTSRKERRLAHK